nr:hypothetical protein Iba_chr09cCG6210 [Ipomoea batatas]
MSFNEIPELSTLLVGRKSSCVSGSLGTELKYRFPAWYKDLEPWADVRYVARPLSSTLDNDLAIIFYPPQTRKAATLIKGRAGALYKQIVRG